MPPIAVVIGAPGAGKSTVGRRVAEALGVAFIDTDRLVEDRAGMSVADIFVTQGEPAFRAQEEQAVADALEGDGIVALGGGAITSAATRERLVGHTVVWLQVDLADATRRVGLNTARPLLLGNVRQTMGSLLEQRLPLYAAAATITVDTTGRPVREVVADVVSSLGGGPAAGPADGRAEGGEAHA